MSENLITFSNVSRFYGEVLGINKVSLTIPPGITSLVGPNGSGKTTLMNLMTGLIRPTQGEIQVLGVSPEDLVRVSVEELLAQPDDKFEQAVNYVLEKNAELYGRLA